MSGLTILLLLIAGACLASVNRDESPLSLSISIPSSPDGNHLLDDGRIPHFHVILLNRSDTAQKVWAPWSETGFWMLRFEVTDADGNASKVTQKKMEKLSHKLPEVCVLQPRESVVFEVHYANTNAWQNFPEPGPGSPLVSMRAVYEIPSNSATHLNQVWTGEVVSEEMKITIRPWQPERDK